MGRVDETRRDRVCVMLVDGVVLFCSGVICCFVNVLVLTENNIIFINYTT